MIDVTYKLESVKHHAASGITWVKLSGDIDYEWMVCSRPDTPAGFIAIDGCNNGSFRYIEKAAFDKLTAK